ncbi:MAG: ATP synthase F1 subunit gamma [candidate division Zixibacteria bacterium HGW-Zixibacteria-1]|nr:MAG: ATP synthase F1 subunit gamma [candidate division Zixibacteria bacterium HGW-Zixibacteria-1]
MPTLRQVKKRIGSVISTRQITKAMEMVAAAKLRKAQMRVMQVRPYSEKLDHILVHLSEASSGGLMHPFFEEREIKKRTLVLVTSDRGLCGSFNTNLIMKARKWLEDKDPKNTELVLIGKKANDFFKRKEWPIVKVFDEWNGNLDYAKARDVVDFLTGRFLAGETDEISLIYSQFITTTRYKNVVVCYLPVERPEVSEKPGTNLEYIFEPSPDAIFTDLMPRYALTKMITALADNFASEHGTRMIAMGAATTNAGEMIETLTLQYNKARQAAITKDLLDIVGGAEALKG